MPTLAELQQAYDDAADALHDATDGLGLAREAAIASITELAAKEIEAVSAAVDQAELKELRVERDKTRVALDAIQNDLDVSMPVDGAPG